MFEQIYPIDTWNARTLILYALACAELGGLFLIIFLVARHLKCRNSVLMILIGIMGATVALLTILPINKHLTEKGSTSVVSGHILITRKCSYAAGSQPGEFSIGDKDFEYGLNSKNYQVTDLVKSSQSQDEYRMEYDQEGRITAIWRYRSK